MISQAATVDGFMATLTPAERAVLGQVRELFKAAGPKVRESMEYRMPCYHLGKNMVGAFNRQKHYLSVYANPAAVDPHRKALKAAGLDCGKSCLRFTKPEQLPIDLVGKIIRQAAKLAAE